MTELYAPKTGALSDLGICLAIISVLVEKAGGRVGLTQTDFDAVGRKFLAESYDPISGVFTLTIVDERPRLDS